MHNMALIRLHFLNTDTIVSTVSLNYSLYITQILSSCNASKQYRCLKMYNIEIYSYKFISTKTFDMQYFRGLVSVLQEQHKVTKMKSNKQF
jgi:hypothetical protein